MRDTMMKHEPTTIMPPHLATDEVDHCLDGGWGLSAWVHDHLRECESCRADVDLVETLDRTLVALPRETPAQGFSAAVMARVKLPEPWTARTWTALRVRWPAFAAAATALTLLVGGMGYWLFGVQGLTPGGLVAFVWNGGQELALRGLMAAARLVYGTGVMGAGRSLTGIPASQALAVLALAGVIGLLALFSITRLVQVRRSPLRETVR